MKKEVKTVNEIAAPADQVWANIRTGKGVDTWMPVITACRVEGNRRYCEAGESKLEETIVSSDDATQTFVYSIEKQELLPVTNILGTMRVEANGQDRSVLYWDVEFDVADEATFLSVKQGIEELYAVGAQGLGQLALA